MAIRIEKSKKAGIERTPQFQILAVDLPSRVGSTQRVNLRGLRWRIIGK
jgi:hypothetical protein